jgi:hypothetical protein
MCILITTNHPAARTAIKPGRNVLAVHLIDRHKGGEHFVDVGLLDKTEPASLPK